MKLDFGPEPKLPSILTERDIQWSTLVAYWLNRAELIEQENKRLRTVFIDAKAAVERDLMHILEKIAATDPDDESEIAELIRCHLDRWACWGRSDRHITLDKAE